MLIRNPKALKPTVKFDAAFEFAAQLEEFKKTLGEWFVERDEIIEAVFAALLTRQHALIVGLHGTCKSELVSTIFRSFKDCAHFNVQCTKFMTEDHVFGIANIKKMQEEGIIEIETGGMLPTADFAFLDELLDSNDAVMRSLLDILNERQFRKGRQVVQCPLKTAIATTNFYTETDQLAAVLDRFLVKMQVSPVEADDSLMCMLMNFLEKEQRLIPVPEFSLAQLQSFHAAGKLVAIDEETLQVYLEVLHEFGKELGGKKYVSDRRKCWGLQLVKMSTLLNKRTAATPEDLQAARYAMCFVNTEEEGVFDRVFTKKVGNLGRSKEIRSKLNTVKTVLDKLQEAGDIDNMDEKDLIDLSRKLKTVINTLDQRDRGDDVDFPDIGREFDALLQQARDMLNKIVSTTAKKIGGK